MALENILGITDSAELARAEEQISEKKAAWLFESGRLDELDAGSFASLAEIHRVVDWSKADKEDYLMAMERSPVKDIEIKHVLRNALTDKIGDREMYMKGINHSYYYEGYNTYKVKGL